jgi:hypothetical protein
LTISAVTEFHAAFSAARCSLRALRDILSVAVLRDIDRRVIADLLTHPPPDDPVTPNQQRAEP